MKHKILFIMSGCLVFGSLTACMSLGFKEPGKTPPRLVETKSKQKQIGWDGHRKSYILWDRPSAFGSVPKELQATGNKLCYEGNFTKAVGYHPKAMGLDGKLIPGGGFLCSGFRSEKANK